ncbi:MAG: hypothetical protein U0Q16_02745 [Bryobacteraceae bacterium]
MPKRALILASAGVALTTGLAVRLMAAPTTVTFTFTRVVELQCDEGFGESCPNDYYPKVEIDSQGLDDGKSRFCCAHGTDFNPNWVFTATVDSTHAAFPIHVELWDQDDLSADDLLDIANGPSPLDIVVNTDTCTWSGGGVSGHIGRPGTSQGSGKDSAKIEFIINSTHPNCQDSDGDGLLDGWEKNGFDADGDGTIDVNLPAMGADASRRDLFLEIDFLAAAGHTHAPLQTALQDVVQAFANAPVTNPDGTRGIQLHIDIGALYGAGAVTKVVGTGGVTGTIGDYGGGGDSFNEAGNTIVDWDGATGNPGTDFFTLKNLNAARNDFFRYAIFVHQTNGRAASNDCTTGWSKGSPGVNFLVSLGGTSGPPANNPCWGIDAAGNSVGTRPQQAGTLMHEFGHTLGLDHGGGDPLNTKPNYQSVMNYAFQACSVPAIAGAGFPGGCDYSRAAWPALNENSLDECRGVDSGAFGLGPSDFNASGVFQGVTNCQPPNNANIAFNLNGDFTDTNGNGTQDPSEPATLGVLNGFNDWNALVYNFRTIPDYTKAGTPVRDEPDPETIARARARLLAVAGPKLLISVNGPAAATPGDSITYQVQVTNRLADGARGPALGVNLANTTPDGAVQTFSLGTVPAGGVRDQAIPFHVACSATDGTALADKAQATGHDLAANELSITALAMTTVQAPVLVTNLSATASVNAGEAITYDITYRNTGSGAATGVTVSMVLPAGVYYSTGLDLGAGPKPNTVTLNPGGTRTLVWNIGTVAAGSGLATIQFTARPTLLATGGTALPATASVTFGSTGGCSYPPVTANSSTTITVVALNPEREPHGTFYWHRHVKEQSGEILARIQATDQRYDNAASDGALSSDEARVASGRPPLDVYLFQRDRPEMLRRELFAFYLNLATRRINAESPVHDKHVPSLTNARDAALEADAALAVPFTPAAKARYHAIREVLDHLND